jgi:hypothetical protein
MLLPAAGGLRLWAAAQGPATLYRGFTPIVTRKVIWCTVFFVCYEEIKELV